MSAERPSEQPKAPKITVNLDPVAQFDDAEAAMKRNELALKEQRARNELETKDRQKSEAEADALLAALDPKTRGARVAAESEGQDVIEPKTPYELEHILGEERNAYESIQAETGPSIVSDNADLKSRWATEDNGAEAEEGPKPIPRWKLGHAQKETLKGMWLEGAERKAVMDAMGIDTSHGVKYGPAFADKVAKYQQEKLGFSWDDPEKVEAGQVPNGIIDENTIMAMALIPGNNINFNEAISHMTTPMTKIDTTQDKLCAKMGFDAEQMQAFFKLMNAPEGITHTGMNIQVQDFQVLKLGFVMPQSYAHLSKAEKAKTNVADGYFGPKSLAALNQKAEEIFPKEKDPNREIVAILLGREMKKPDTEVAKSKESANG